MIVSNQWSVASKSVFRLALCASLFALCVPAAAQQPAKIPRIGFVGASGTSNDPRSNFNVFRQGLRDLGYVDGKNILIEYRNAEGKLDLIPILVDELVQLKIDVLVSTNPTAIRAAKQATKTIPIVMVSSVDPVATGIVDSLARPGGNITGLSLLARELSGKRLELLIEAVPGVRRVGVLWDADSSAAAIGLKEYEAAARALKVQLQPLEVRGPSPDLESAFQAATKGRASALIVVRTSVLNRYSKLIADLAIKTRLPSMFEVNAYVEVGGLMSYANSDSESFKRAAIYVDKILKGAKPADLPVEQPTKFEFVINLKTAKALNLTIPQSVLFRADRVIR
jgi:putative tryptophan/tyrosine transport system substrate-binding protein